VTSLGVRDQRRLEELEALIERGLRTFVEVGAALMEIRDSRLYRETHATFDAYCRSRWGMSRRHANRLVKSVEVAAALGPVGRIPENEAQARELAPLLDQPDRLRHTWAKIVELHQRPTAAQIRAVVARPMPVHSSSASPEWSTPQDLFDELDEEFGFDVDVCATPASAKCQRFFTEADDGLAQDWVGVCWMNPPYEKIGPWVRKAWESAQAGATVVCLLQASTDTRWWWRFCRHGEIRFLPGRLRFGGCDHAAPFGSAVVIFPRPPEVVWWEWERDREARR
jgi:phage N-6-adenine-methyltransferase